MIVTTNGNSVEIGGLEAVRDLQTMGVILTLIDTHEHEDVVHDTEVLTTHMTSCFLPVGSRRWVRHNICTTFLQDHCQPVKWSDLPEAWRQRLRRLVFDVDGNVADRLKVEPTLEVKGDAGGH